MKVYATLDEFTKAEKGCVVTVGNFDGVHLGHQAIIARARDLARRQDLPLVAMTFDPSASAVLRPERSPRVITPGPVKGLLMAELGLDSLVVIHPTPAFLSLTPEEFAGTVLKDRIGARYVVEGQTFNFGRRRAGTMVSLAALGRKFDFQTELVPVRTVTTETGPVAINSTIARGHIGAGELDKARQCLGRFFAVAGTIVPGLGHGREIGFPTANLRFYDPRQLVPDDGVFAGFARLGSDLDSAWADQTAHPAAVSIGRCPTMPDGRWQTEAFLLDYDAPSDDLYGKHIVLTLVERIRPQARFESTVALSNAITDDVNRVRCILDRVELP